MKTIAFDIDGTWTTAPNAWLSVLMYLSARGFTCIVVTGAEQPEDKLRRLGVPISVPVIVASGVFKKSAAMDAGFAVDIWIDDMPGTIEPARILSGNLE